jgi:hypothetical protein
MTAGSTDVALTPGTGLSYEVAAQPERLEIEDALAAVLSFAAR